MKKQEMLNIINNTYNLNILECNFTTKELQDFMRFYRKGYTIKDVHDCSEEDFKNCIRFTYAYVAVK